MAGGVSIAEITMTVPGAIRVMEKVADRYGDKVLLGAGTILDAETARAAILAGAEFLVSPSLDVGVIEGRTSRLGREENGLAARKIVRPAVRPLPPSLLARRCRDLLRLTARRGNAVETGRRGCQGQARQGH